MRVQLLLLIAILLGGCSGPLQANRSVIAETPTVVAPTPVRVVQMKATLPAPTISPTSPPPLQLCRASDLDVEVGLVSSTVQMVSVTFELTNTLSMACRLTGTLEVGLWGRHGRKMVTPQHNETGSEVELRDGEAARFVVAWRNWCYFFGDSILAGLQFSGAAEPDSVNVNIRTDELVDGPRCSTTDPVGELAVGQLRTGTGVAPTPVWSPTRPSVSMATATTTPMTSSQNITYLLRHRPPPGTEVHIDAYFFGGGIVGSAPLQPQDRIPCPIFPSQSLLTEQPFVGELVVLGSSVLNPISTASPYLIATIPDALRPGIAVKPGLPFYARLQGHLDDPRQANCPDGEHIFVVEQVEEVYRQEPSPTSPSFFQPPTDAASWPRYHDAKLGYSVAYPRDWTVEAAWDARFLATVQWRSQWSQAYTVVLRVRAHETPIDGYLPADPPPLPANWGLGPYVQNSVGQPDGTQRLQGYMGIRPITSRMQEVVVLFNAKGRTYEIALRYPLGFDAYQPLLTSYQAVVDSLRLDRAAEAQ